LGRLSRAAASILLLALMSASIAYSAAALAEVPRMNAKVLVFQVVSDENKTRFYTVMYLYNDTVIVFVLYGLYGYPRMLKYDPATNTLHFWLESSSFMDSIKSYIERYGFTGLMAYLLNVLPKAFVNNLKNVVSMGWLNVELINSEPREWKVYRTTLKVDASAVQVADTSYMGYPAVMVKVSNRSSDFGDLIEAAIEAYWRTDGVLLYVRFYAKYYGESAATVGEIVLAAEDDLGAKEAKETLTQTTVTQPATQTKTTAVATTLSHPTTEIQAQTLYTATTTSTAVERTTTQLPIPSTSTTMQTPAPSTTPTAQSPTTVAQTSTPIPTLSTKTELTTASPTVTQTTAQGTQTAAGIQMNTTLVIIGVVAIASIAIAVLALKKR